jgi:hypothetical protein
LFLMEALDLGTPENRKGVTLNPIVWNVDKHIRWWWPWLLRWHWYLLYWITLDSFKLTFR